jgi:hypothetical protein
MNWDDVCVAGDACQLCGECLCWGLQGVGEALKSIEISGECAVPRITMDEQVRNARRHRV